MRSRMITTLLLVWCLFTAPNLAAAESAWGKLNFLLGNWTGSGTGSPGQGAGYFSFLPDLQNRILIRRAHSEYPSAKDKTTMVHDDLLIVYAEDLSKAIYFDNEGHVIHYAITTDPSARTATFVSVESPPTPGFRLTYRQVSAEDLQVTFEISNSGKPEDFKTYLSGTSRREQPTRK